MDELLRDLLKEKNKNSLAVDEILGKIQERTLSVMGPLSKVWLKLENAKKSDAPLLSLDKILSLLKQTICLLGQTSNSISYHQRYNILSSVCTPQSISCNCLETQIFKAVAGDFEVKAPPTQMFLNTSPVIPNVELANIHPLIKCLFSKHMLTKAVNIPPTGRISHFLVNLQKLALNQDILSVVKGYKIPFIKIPFQRKIPNFTKMNKKQIALVDLELKEMLKKGAIMRTQLAQGEFMSSLFLVGKKDGGYCPVINLKMLNQFIPFLHFKLEGLSQLKHIIQEGDWMCKLDLKDAYFSVPLDRNSRKFVQW